MSMIPIIQAHHKQVHRARRSPTGMCPSFAGLRIVATNDGNLFEIFYNPQSGQGQATLSNLNGIIDIAAFFTNDDNYRHVIVSTSDGNVHEIFYNPQSGQGQALLGNFPGVTKVSAFYATNDAFFNRRVIVTSSDGRLYEIKYSPRAEIIRLRLLNTGSVTDIYPSNSIVDILFASISLRIM